MKWNKTGIYIAGSVVVTGIVTLGLHLFKRKKKSTDKFGNEWLGDDQGLQGGVESYQNPLGTSLVEPNWEQPFNRTFMQDVIQWVAPKKIIKLKDDYADQLAQEIRKAKGRWWISNDDEEAVSKLFSQKLKDKVQVANVSEAFFKRYDENLLTYLKSFLNDSEMKKYVFQPIAQLKNYREA